MLHHHPAQDEIFFVVKGKGAMTVGDDKIPVKVQSPVYLPASIRHCAPANRDNRLVMMFTKCTSTATKATE